MKITLPIVLGAALIASSAVPALASPKHASSQAQEAQENDRARNTQAYSDGYTQGQTDARAGTARNDQPAPRWTMEEDQRAWRQGYDAGYQEAASAVRPADRLGHGTEQADQFGYQDGLAAGRHDRMKGEKFHPEDSGMYKNADRGWTPEISDKDYFKQHYRQGYVRGYQEGYNGTGPK